jgi:peptidoglycan/LPS O-acetylase OafA/YrhL
VKPRNAGLDLVRAIAVLLVMASHWANNFGVWYGFHAPQFVFDAGEVGVDLFFALSGFLIGRILLELVDRGPSWRALGVFLVRRGMRTLPLYYLWLAVLVAVWPPTAGDHPLRRMILLLQNFAWPMPPNDFFAVSWSLTIEEWFYLGFGTCLVGAAMVLGRRALWPVLLVFIAGPLSLRFLVPGYHTWSNGLWHSVIFRIDSVAYGVVLAHIWRRAGGVLRHTTPALLLGLALIFGAWSDLLLPSHLLPELNDTAMVVGAVLCLPAALRLRTIRSWPGWLIARISAQSYGLYLMHLTILVDLAQGLYWRHLITRPVAVLVAVALPFVLSWASFVYLERPLLARRPAQP